MIRIDVAGAVTVVTLLALTGCSDSDSSPKSDPTRQVDQAVRVAGTFRINGGPAPGIDEPLSGTVTFDGPVTEDVGAVSGTFTVGVPPGEYTVTGQPKGHFAAATCPAAAITVTEEQTSPVEVMCFVE